MKYHLIVLDVDGTLLDDEGRLSNENKDALIRAEKEFGIRLALTSARPLDKMIGISEQLLMDKYSGYLIPERGIQLYNCSTKSNLDFSSEDRAKAKAIEHLLEKLDLRKESLIAAGDSKSDVEMLQMAGLGVAVANAPEVVKACADYVTMSNNENGVAHMLDKYIFNHHDNLPFTAEDINNSIKNTMVDYIGMKVTQIARGYIEGTMPVNEKTCQPLGIVHGGANLAFAETLAGIGSVVLCKEDEIQVGMQVSGNHVSTALVGDTMRAVGKIMHQGRSTHVWTVEIYSMNSGKLISTVRVLNSILKRR